MNKIKKPLILAIFCFLVLFLAGCNLPTNPQTLTERSAPPTSLPSVDDWWRPTPGLSWQWQLDGDIDLSITADVYDLDYETDQQVIDRLHQRGAKLICYISVGSFEEWREDADSFPEEVLGSEYDGWVGERWLDIRRIDLLAPIMLARMDICAEKGFDAIEPDNLEVHTNDTGFPLSYQDQLDYALWLAEQAHARGLAIGLKNAPDQAMDLVEVYDFAITEDCFYFEWCDQMTPFIDAGKAVFAAEYADLHLDFPQACRQSEELDFSTILKRRDLDAWLKTCP